MVGAGSCCSAGRWDTDFEELEFLGKGAFGSVTKVRNKLDGRIYTLKKIRLTSDRKLDKILREARLLSGLNHERIQRYFNCWIEDVEDCDSDTEETHTIKQQKGEHIHEVAHAAKDTTGGMALEPHAPMLRGDSVFDVGTAWCGNPESSLIRVDISDPRVSSAFATMTCSICHTRYIDWEVTMEDWRALTAALHPLNLCQQCYVAAATRSGVDLSHITMTTKLPPGYVAWSPDSAKSAQQRTQNVKLRRASRKCLFILMEYCDYTLMEVVKAVAPRVGADSEVLDHGNGSIYGCTHMAASRLWQLFWQIVEGLAYLHSCHIVHRDLKPSNVFASGRDALTATVKIGDLGLATSIVVGSSSTTDEHGAHGVHDTANRHVAVTQPLGGHGHDHDMDGEAAVKRARLLPSADGDADSDADVARTRGHGHPAAGSTGSVCEATAPQPPDETHCSRKDASLFTSVHEKPTKGSGLARVRRREDMLAEHKAAIDAAPATLTHAVGAMGHTHIHHRGNTHGVGTYLYMAPESAHGGCTDKSDMFSLGVVLYEMWSRFDTQHERVRMLDALKHGAVPRTFIDAFPIQAQLISNLLQPEPSKRPSAADLLRYRFFNWAPASTLSLAVSDVHDEGVTAAIVAGTLHVAGPLSPHHTLPTPGISATAAAYGLPLEGEGPTMLADASLLPHARTLAHDSQAESHMSAPGLHIDIPQEGLILNPTAVDARAMTDLERADAAMLRISLRDAWNTIAAQSKLIKQLQASLSYARKHAK